MSLRDRLAEGVYYETFITSSLVITIALVIGSKSQTMDPSP